MKISEAIITTAYKYLNTKEIPDNRGWYDKLFYKAMAKVGWEYKQHWCAYFMELVWREAYGHLFPPETLLGKEIDKDLSKLCSANSQKTFRNFENDNFWETGTLPTLGAAVIWKYTKVAGHTAAAVVEITDKGFFSIEGNSKNKVSKNFHKFNEANLMGFIYPKEF